MDRAAMADFLRRHREALRPADVGIPVTARRRTPGLRREDAALLGDRSGYTGLARSEIYRWFTDPAERLRYPEHDRDRQSRAQVANLRSAYGSMGPRSRAGEIVRALQKASREFTELWERHEVARRFEDHKVLVHPELGPIELDCQVLFNEDQSIALLVLTAPPRTEGYEKLQLLAVLGQERFADTGSG
jgi:hypothetical protein